MHQTSGDNRDHTQLLAQPSNGLDLTVIVPTRNESKNISTLLDRLESVLVGRSAEILFVDDSTDDTPRVIEQEAAARTIPVCIHARPEQRRDDNRQPQQKPATGGNQGPKPDNRQQGKPEQRRDERPKNPGNNAGNKGGGNNPRPPEGKPPKAE